jgi:hypothetical protein
VKRADNFTEIETFQHGGISFLCLMALCLSVLIAVYVSHPCSVFSASRLAEVLYHSSCTKVLNLMLVSFQSTSNLIFCRKPVYFFFIFFHTES